METLLANLSALSDDAKAWALAGLVTLKALHSIYLSLRCPVMRGVADVTEEMIAEAKAYKFAPPPSYLMIMIGGVAIAIAGLYMLNDTQYGPLALIALVVGVYMFITEPTRLFVNVGKMEVYSSTGEAGDRNELARDRLGAAHLERAAYETAIAVAVVAVLWFF
ncbi:MAG: hypothetical protein AAFN79_11250 [Pseudomonadota bacterium]